MSDEFDLADTTRAQFDMLGHLFARHFAADLRVQSAHGIDRAEVEILAEDEGAAGVLQRAHPFLSLIHI